MVTSGKKADDTGVFSVDIVVLVEALTGCVDVKKSIGNNEGGEGGDMVGVWDTGEGKGEIGGADLVRGGVRYNVQVEIWSVLWCSADCILFTWVQFCTWVLLQASSEWVLIAVCVCSVKRGESGGGVV